MSDQNFGKKISEKLARSNISPLHHGWGCTVDEVKFDEDSDNITQSLEVHLSEFLMNEADQIINHLRKVAKEFREKTQKADDDV